jgi:hypothetical protein
LGDGEKIVSGLKKSGLCIFCFVLLLSCGRNDRMQERFKNNLLDFKAEASFLNAKEDRPAGAKNDFGKLWAAGNPINVRRSADTLFIEVNTAIRKGARYEGGFEQLRDTLFLYACNKTADRSLKVIHGTLYYSLLCKTPTPSGFVFRELRH